jgi:hypothetical protein
VTRLVTPELSTVLRSDASGYKTQRRVMTFRPSTFKVKATYIFERPSNGRQTTVSVLHLDNTVSFFKVEDSDARRENPHTSEVRT